MKHFHFTTPTLSSHRDSFKLARGFPVTENIAAADISPCCRIKKTFDLRARHFGLQMLPAALVSGTAATMPSAHNCHAILKSQRQKAIQIGYGPIMFVSGVLSRECCRIVSDKGVAERRGSGKVGRSLSSVLQSSARE
jgi:hypothetical protein